MDDEWRRRLREAINATGRKHSDVAWGAGISPVTLSRVLNGASEPLFATVIRIAREADVTVGSILGEQTIQPAPTRADPQ